MANTCYGQPDTKPPERARLVAGEAGDAYVPDASPGDIPGDAPPLPVAAPSASGRALVQRDVQTSPPNAATPCTKSSDSRALCEQTSVPSVGRALSAPIEPAVATAPSAGCSTDTAERTVDERDPVDGPDPVADGDAAPLALEQMSPLIEGGMLMVFGPEGDPVPPRVFFDAAAGRPDQLLSMPDGTAVRAARIATVLGAQTLGRLGAAEPGGAWISMMLGRGGPEPASDEVLQAEQGRCVLTAHGGQLMVACEGDEFRIVDVTPDVPPADAMRLMLSDEVPLSVASLIALLGAQGPHRATHVTASAGGDEEASQGSTGAGEAVEPPGSDDLVLPGCTMELRADGLWFGVPGLAASGAGFQLTPPATNGPHAPVVHVVSAKGDTVSPADLIGCVLVQRGIQTIRLNAVTRSTTPLDSRARCEPPAVGSRALAADHKATVGHPGANGEHGAGSGPAPGRVRADATRGDRAGDNSGADRDPDASDEAASDHDIAHDHAAFDRIVAAHQQALPRLELDLDGLAAMADASRDLDFPTACLAWAPDDSAVVAVPEEVVAVPEEVGPESVREDTLRADQPTSATGGFLADRVSGDSVPAPLADLVGSARQPRGRDAADGIAGDSVRDGTPVDACLAAGPDDGGAEVSVLGPGSAARQQVDLDLVRAATKQVIGSAGADILARPPLGPVDVDADSIALVVIRGVPDDATLSTGTRDEDGSWSISPIDLSNVMISLAGGGRSDEDGGEPPVVEGDLDITGIAFTEHGELVAISETVPLADYVADPATKARAASDPADGSRVAPEPRTIPLDVDSRPWAGELFDALVVRDLPAGARLSAGSYDPAIDGWVLMPQDLPALAITPPAGLGQDFTLTLMGVVLRPGDGNAARVLARLPVTPA